MVLGLVTGAPHPPGGGGEPLVADSSAAFGIHSFFSSSVSLPLASGWRVLLRASLATVLLNR
jgi:hypothetical protein